MTFCVVGVNSGRETIGSKWIALREVATSCPSIIEYIPIAQNEVVHRRLIKQPRRIDINTYAAAHTINSSNVLHYSILRYQYIGAMRAQTLVRKDGAVVHSNTKIIVFDRAIAKNSGCRLMTVGLVHCDERAPVMDKLLEIEYNGNRLWMPSCYVNYDHYDGTYTVFSESTRIAVLDFSKQHPIEIHV